jgi:SWI/SNF-related matrix-associated actin-dependent regulator 1 of chromatin subfamily A
VDFVIEKEGRALIADEMGLGKSIQGIASMSVYHQEWPLLVLCPSSARYHWENEFRHWLGKNSTINQSEHAGAFSQEMDNDESEDEPEETQETTRPSMSLLGESQIHVLTSSKDKIFPNESTRVVICSYGLAPMLVTSDSIRPGMFKCCIVDESHVSCDRIKV